MRRALSLPLSLALVLVAGCRFDAAEARLALASREPEKRGEGARALQQAYAKDRLSLRDHGDAYWALRLERVRGLPAGRALGDLGVFGPMPIGGEGGGGGASEHYRLDDFWTTTLHRDTRADTILGHEGPMRDVAHVDVQRPVRFTGAWKTYYVNGSLYEDVEFEGGVLRRDRVYHDSGRLRYERVYEDGLLEGTVVTRYADGSPEWEDTYARGKQVGVQRWFYPSGKVRQEAHYVDDKVQGRMQNFAESGAVTFCAEYRAGMQVDAGCGAR